MWALAADSDEEAQRLASSSRMTLSELRRGKLIQVPPPEKAQQYLRERGALLGEQIYQHSYPHCWRSKTPVVFRAVEQFFIRVDALRAKALASIESVDWVPAWGRNRIAGTVESRPDWCISRQRSWGVPLPVFYDAKGAPIVQAEIAR